jgi:hypothetical protein
MATMTVVLVHGNPETEAIWGPLVDALGRDDVVRLISPLSAMRCRPPLRVVGWHGEDGPQPSISRQS